MPTTIEEKLTGWVSVTEVLDYFQEPRLVEWKVKVGKREAKRLSTVAMKIGTRVHELIYQDWKCSGSGQVFKKSDSIEVRNCMQGWKQFKADYKPEILMMETELKQERLKIVGHRDMLVKVGEKFVILDLKTSSFIQQKHWLQVGKYADIDFEGKDLIGILRLDKNLGIYEYKTKSDFLTYSILFNGLLINYRFFNQTPMGSTKEVANGDSSPTSSSTNTEERDR